VNGLLSALVAQTSTTSTTTGLPGAIAAFERGDIALGVGLVLGLIVGVLRYVRIRTILDGTVAVVVTAVVAFLGGGAEALIAGGGWLDAILEGLKIGGPIVIGGLVQPRE